MSGISGRNTGILGIPLSPVPDSDGVVHQDVKDLIDVTPAGQAFRVQGKHILVGEADKITDRRPRAIELMGGEPLETRILKPTRIYPRNTNKYDHRELERQRVRAALAKEKGK